MMTASLCVSVFVGEIQCVMSCFERSIRPVVLLLLPCLRHLLHEFFHKYVHIAAVIHQGPQFFISNFDEAQETEHFLYPQQLQR